jgi:phosphatidylglycerophosphate synthase
MRSIARGLNALSGGRLSPNMVTLIGLLAHVYIAWLIATARNNVLAAILLIVFGLFDTLDGELARLQKRASASGMLLDASTDRMKEVLLYMGLIVAFVHNQDSLAFGLEYYAAAIVAACGASLLVSYVKAKGETAVKDAHLSPNEINRLFGDGIMRFEVRMFVLIIGLLTSQLEIAVLIIAVFGTLTAISRLISISHKLNNVQN